MNWNQNWTQLLVIALIIGFSVVSWAARKLQEQAAKRRALEEVDRRRTELLRTGKDPSLSAPAGPPMSEQEARLREIATRRQAQLQELRKRAQMRQQQGGPVVVRAPGAGTPRPAPAPVPTPVARPAPKARPVPQARPAAVPTPVQRPGTTRRVRPPARPAEPARREEARVEGESHTERLVKEIPPEAPARKVERPDLVPSTAREWRRALVLREVLKPPPGLTGGHAGPDFC